MFSSVSASTDILYRISSVCGHSRENIVIYPSIDCAFAFRTLAWEETNILQPPLPFLADITAGGVDKGSAIREFCEHYGIDYEETAGIGDGRNDKAIFEAVKLKFAVNNGHPELKALADYCVDSVAEAIEMIMENNRE